MLLQFNIRDFPLQTLLSLYAMNEGLQPTILLDKRGGVIIQNQNITERVAILLPSPSSTASVTVMSRPRSRLANSIFN